jgi:hypothetical protein
MDSQVPVEPVSPVEEKITSVENVKVSSFKKIKNKWKFVGSFIILALLSVSVVAIQYKTSLNSKAAYTLPTTASDFAANEKAFVNTFWTKYYGDITTKEGFHTKLDAYVSQGNPGLNGGYRTLCTTAIVAAVAKGKGGLSANDPFVQYFSEMWNKDRFLDDFPPEGYWTGGRIYVFIRPVSAQLCLMAENLMRDVLPTATKNSMLEAIATADRRMLVWITGVPAAGEAVGKEDPTSNYRNAAKWGSIGDGQGEEVGTMYSALLASVRLLPPGVITDKERSSWYEVAKKLAAWGYSRCQGDCVFKGNGKTPDAQIKYLSSNHEMYPNIDYTLAVPHFYGEMAAVFNQLDGSFPKEIFSDGLKGAMKQMGNDIDGYITKTADPARPKEYPAFSYTGTFDFIDAFYEYNPRLTRNFADQTYLMKPIDGVRSTLPQDSITAISQYVTTGLPNGNSLSSFVFKGGDLWPYECQWPKSELDKGWYYLWCMSKPKTTLTAWLQSKNIKPPTDPIKAQEWSSNPLPSEIDAISQFYLPGSNQLKIYIFKGTRGWHFVCSPTECNAWYTQSLDKFWPTGNRDAAGWTTNPPPADKIDSISQYIEVGTSNIKSYFTRGDRIWAYTCGNGACNALYTKNISDYFKQISDVNGSWLNAGWIGNNLPPTTNLNAQMHYYLPDNKTLKVFMFSGNKVWEASCMVGGSCIPVSVKILSEFYSSQIKYQYDWQLTKGPDDIELKGVASWGRDATFQNASFAFIYLMDPTYLSKYQALQVEELNRGRASGITNWPINYENGSWNYNTFSKTTGGGFGEVWPGYMTYGLSGELTGHLWLNMQSAYCSAIAYLMLTPTKLTEQSTTSNTKLTEQSTTSNTKLTEQSTTSNILLSGYPLPSLLSNNTPTPTRVVCANLNQSCRNNVCCSGLTCSGNHCIKPCYGKKCNN